MLFFYSEKMSRDFRAIEIIWKSKKVYNFNEILSHLDLHFILMIKERFSNPTLFQTSWLR